MKVVIIEDEAPARERLTALLTGAEPGCNIIATHTSVAEAGKWFSQNAAPDLVLLDVHLADGSAFDLLKIVKIDCPVIFTTAHSNYALNAFKANSIDYLLKPVKKADLEAALKKLKEFRQLFKAPDINTLARSMPAGEYKKRFIIRIGDSIRTLAVEDIAFCLSESKSTYAKTFDGRSYPMDQTLDGLEQMLNPQHFFRINRQYLISLKAIKEMKAFSKARVIVKLEPPVKDPPIVSGERAADFKLWLAGDLV